MHNFSQKVAVITGAASGLGRSIAHKCAALNMKTVISDIEQEPLLELESSLAAMGIEVLSVVCDVSAANEVDELLKSSLERFQGVHLLFNNAGVGPGEGLLESTSQDWDWGLGVNFFGQLYALQRFVPVMLNQKENCHIVNTASLAGLTPFHPDAVYQVSKAASVALSEHLYHSLSLRGSSIGVSVFCPSYVNTRIVDSERNRPDALKRRRVEDNLLREKIKLRFKEQLARSMSSEEAVQILFEGIQKKQFYIFTDADYQPIVISKLQTILDESRPSPVKLAL